VSGRLPWNFANSRVINFETNECLKATGENGTCVIRVNFSEPSRNCSAKSHLSPNTSRNRNSVVIREFHSGISFDAALTGWWEESRDGDATVGIVV